ncbi:hypothetical protein OIE40_15425 [Micropruina sp. KQZ13P-5]|nr:hypothetical protein [Micropruina sp. KQZ13P-5]
MFGAHVMFGHIAVIAAARVLRDRDPCGEQAVQDADGDQVVVADHGRRRVRQQHLGGGQSPVEGGLEGPDPAHQDPGGLAVFPQRPEA